MSIASRKLVMKVRVAFLFAMLISLSAPSYAQSITQLEPVEVETYVAQQSSSVFIAMHYSSDDGSCSYCVTNNGVFRAAATRLGPKFDYAEVISNPWDSFFAPGTIISDYQNDIGYPILGLPAIIVFQNGEPIAQINGSHDDLFEKLNQLIGTKPLAGDTQVTNPVVQIDPSQISDVIQSMSADKPFFLSLSSPDLGCPPCTLGNTNLRSVAANHADGWNFGQIYYNPWGSFTQDPSFLKFVQDTGTEIKGLPTSLVIYKGRIIAQVTPTIDLDRLLSEALPKVLAME